MVGYFPLFKAEQWLIRRRVKSELKGQIPEEDLHEIVIFDGNASEVEWTRPDKEFRFHGSMYDILRSETKADGTHYFCINDKEEESLFVHLDELTQQRSNQSPSPLSHAQKVIKSFLSNLFVSHLTSLELPPPLTRLGTSVYSKLYFFIFSGSIFQPPEQSAFPAGMN